MTALEYIRSKSLNLIPDDTLGVILLDRGVSSESEVNGLDKRTKELLFADTLMIRFTGVLSKGGETHTHGGFTHKEGTVQFGDTRRFRDIAMSIYKRYDDDAYEDDKMEWIDNDY